MKILDHLENVWLEGSTVLTIGAFDGVHLGHQALIRHVVENARVTHRQSGVVTFYPHPVNVLSPKHSVRYITTPGEKARLFEQLGVDIMMLLQFTSHLAESSARQFAQMLVDHLHPEEIWIGPDFALGKNREGNAEYLASIGKELGFSLHVMPPVIRNSDIVSSSRIRRLLAAGEIEQVTELLGRYYSMTGEVVPGMKRGRQLGYPTANLEVRNEQAVPRDGVYACFSIVGDDRYPAVANLGVRPTFNDTKHLLEVLLLDVEMDLYGCDLVVEFVKWLRPEMRFQRVEDLIRQMELDVATARAVLRGTDPSTQEIVCKEVCDHEPRRAPDRVS